VTEDDYLRRVLDTATIHGWRVAHFRPAKTAKGWRTPMQGHPGLPDLVLARNGRVILAELKSDRGRPTVDQVAWLAALGDHGRLWRPKEWTAVLSELTRPEED
jgi:hypothetical protein